MRSPAQVALAPAAVTDVDEEDGTEDTAENANAGTHQVLVS